MKQKQEQKQKQNKTKNQDPDKKKKEFFLIRFLRLIKRITFFLCGKARWLLLVIVVTATILTLIEMNFSISAKVNAVTDDNTHVMTETPLVAVADFSINDKGIAAVSCETGTNGLASVFNADTNRIIYAGSSYATENMLKDDGFYPSNFAMTDNNELYAVRTYYEDYYRNRTIIKESIVILSEEYDFTHHICDIKYDPSEMLRESTLSELHYYNGEITFANIERDKVTLYSIDTDTKALRISRPYPTDRFNTVTVNVIPIDGGFLFLQSNGNVYHVDFDEPIGERIYTFDTSPDSAGKAPYFTHATLVDGKLYVFDSNSPTKIYLIEDGSAREIFDIGDVRGHDGSIVTFIDSYVPNNREHGKSALAICLNDSLFTYSDGKLTDKDIIINIPTKIACVIAEILSWLLFASVFGLLINIIIRKKTLLYKQMIATVPICMLLSLVISVRIYNYIFNQNNLNTRDELEIISEFGKREFEGYDFSQLLKADGSTGAEYNKLCDKLREINTGHTQSWSEDYVFSIVYRKDDTTSLVIAGDDKLSMPMCRTDVIYPEQDFKDYSSSGDIYVSETITDFFSVDAGKSEILAFGRINDKDNLGKIYLKVGTASRRFWYQRRKLLLSIYSLVVLIIATLVLTILLTSLYITRAIRIATGVVESITKGDLSARIDYRSDDELGNICTQVNSMGKSLEELFEEKDRSEKFYYKFVPEQFRKLLGKEKFTDLSLGDSSTRDLTVLFCDIRSFSINSEIMTAKENFEFVNVIYGIAGPIIRGNGGFVDKYIGDAVMALFDNADAAVKSGIEIYRAIVLDPDAAERLGVSDINIGIGIHSGMARIGIVGESERLSGTVISDTVNLSSRLESLTKQYKTAMLISKDTVDRMSDPDSLDLRYLGIVQVAGVNEVKAIYEVLDCLPEEERSKRHDNSKMLREAIRLFHLGRRAETEQTLLSLNSSGSGDHVSEIYLDYIKELSPEDKSNVFRFVRK